MPSPRRWRFLPLVLPLLIPAGSMAAPSAAIARAPETASVLEAMEAGTVPRAAIEALLNKAEAGDTEAAEVAGRLFDRAIGVRWDPPTALRWYTAAALAGNDSAVREAQRLWRGMPPVSQRRAEALLARYFTDGELATIKLGPVRRPTTQRSWMTHLNGAEYPVAPPAKPVVATTPAMVPAVTAVPAVPLLPPTPRAPSSAMAPALVPTRQPALLGTLPVPSSTNIQPAAAPATAAPAGVPATGVSATGVPGTGVSGTEPKIPRPSVKPSQLGPTHASLVVASNAPIPSVKPKR